MSSGWTAVVSERVKTGIRLLLMGNPPFAVQITRYFRENKSAAAL
jgi:hypothetical protein